MAKLKSNTKPASSKTVAAEGAARPRQQRSALSDEPVAATTKPASSKAVAPEGVAAPRWQPTAQGVEPAAVVPVAVAKPARDTKQALIVSLLQREGGASLHALVAATGWLPHTTRAALTRLRQAGSELSKSKDAADRTIYRIAPTARAARSRKVA
jgi:hypothetical protein